MTAPKTVSKNDFSVAVSGGVSCGALVETGAYPLFPTDLHPQTVAMMGSVPFESVVCEKIFGADRFKYIDGLGKQGLCYRICGDTVTVNGGIYCAAKVGATDLRGGAANIIAALCAKGESVVQNAEYVERGYSDIILKLRSLGADILYGGE